MPKIFLLLALVATACSYKPEDAGLCKLNCSNAVIGANDSSMKFSLKTSITNTTCSDKAAGQNLNDPMFAQFLLTESFDNGTDTAGSRPVPNISIEPIVNGLRSNRPEDNPNLDADGLPARYRGILTPKSNWCTDSCGVITLEVAALCPPVASTSELSIQVHTGALYSDPAVFKVETQAATN